MEQLMYLMVAVATQGGLAGYGRAGMRETLTSGGLKRPGAGGGEEGKEREGERVRERRVEGERSACVWMRRTWCGVVAGKVTREIDSAWPTHEQEPRGDEEQKGAGTCVFERERKVELDGTLSAPSLSPFMPCLAARAATYRSSSLHGRSARRPPIQSAPIRRSTRRSCSAG